MLMGKVEAVVSHLGMDVQHIVIAKLIFLKALNKRVVNLPAQKVIALTQYLSGITMKKSQLRKVAAAVVAETVIVVDVTRKR